MFFLMIRRPPRSTRTAHSFPTLRSSDLPLFIIVNPILAPGMASLRRFLDFRGGNAVRVLALASQKGGSGKTTMSGHLAVQAHLAGAGPVVLIDIAPHASLADWCTDSKPDLPAFHHTDRTVALEGQR